MAVDVLLMRYLRIAFSITCRIACVLLIVLWVRSYEDADDVLCFSLPGLDSVTLSQWYGDLQGEIDWRDSATGVTPHGPISCALPARHIVSIPYWPLVLVATMLAGIPGSAGDSPSALC